MSVTVLKNANVLLPDLTFVTTDVTLENGKIASVGATDAPGTDLSGRYLIPGFVDIHTHGCNGGDHLDGEFEATAAICKRMAQVGTTTVLSTIMTQSKENMIKAAENTRLCAAQDLGAKIRGIYLEGPFFCEQYKGAQHPMYLIDPENQLIDDLQKQGVVFLKLRIAVTGIRLLKGGIAADTVTGVVV